jgi:hypothetical protein
MHKFFILLNVVSLTVSVSAFAQCKQANLQSTDGTQISIHYSSIDGTDGESAWVNPTIHVTLPNNGCNAKGVTVELINYYPYMAQFDTPTSQALTLNQDPNDECNYSGTPGNVGFANDGGEIGQQIAVRVDSFDGSSNWLVFSPPSLGR